MARRSKPSRVNPHEVDYTITGLVVIVAIVVLTGFFLRDNSQDSSVAPTSNLGGLAYSTGDALAPQGCEVASFCDGSRLLRQGADCTQYEAFCTYGCSYQGGQARCNS